MGKFKRMIAVVTATTIMVTNLNVSSVMAKDGFMGKEVTASVPVESVEEQKAWNIQHLKFYAKRELRQMRERQRHSN